MSDLPKTFKAAVAVGAGEPLVVKEVPLVMPGPGQILVKVIACGVCHTDLAVVGGIFGPIFPRISGHEIVGDVVATGAGVSRFAKGDRVGGAWHGGHDGNCRSCNRGQFQLCENEKYTGVHFDGGFGEYVLLRDEATARVSKDMDPAEVAPLLCAGVTTFNGIRKQNVEQGNLVAVQGLGGLGHMAVQYAAKMGYRVVAISSGSAKKDFALKLGAHDYIDASQEEPAKKLKSMGGAALIVATAPNAKAISPLVDGLQPGGKLLLLAAVGPIEFNSIPLVMQGCSVVGWLTGNARDCEEAIEFARDNNIKCMIEKYSLADVGKALQVCHSGAVRFRSVIVL
ncbi:alcohol dehydrogenase [Xylaria sp. CBS 124048]|nr:alcohol dehydrogenase [Xylaria sp. CBS 124048]